MATVLQRDQLFRLSARRFLAGKWSAVFSNHLCFLSSRIQLIFSVSHGRVLVRKCQALANSAHVREARSKVSGLSHREIARLVGKSRRAV